MSDDKLVTQPNYYRDEATGAEAGDFAQWLGFWLGNAFKYVWRYDKKGTPIRDLEKALECLSRHDHGMQADRMPSNITEARFRNLEQRSAMPQMLALVELWNLRWEHPRGDAIREIRKLLDAERAKPMPCANPHPGCCASQHPNAEPELRSHNMEARRPCDHSVLHVEPAGGGWYVARCACCGLTGPKASRMGEAYSLFRAEHAPERRLPPRTTID